MFEATQSDENFNSFRFLNEPAQRKILIVAFHEWANPIGVFLEITEKLSSQGNYVFVGIWGDQVKFADTSNIYSPMINKVFGIESIQNKLRKYLEKNTSVKIIRLNSSNLPSRFVKPTLKKIHLRDIQRKYVNPPGKGFAIGSSLVNGSKKSEANGWFSQNLVEKFSESYDDVYSKTKKILKNKKIDTLIVYNGRLTHEHAVIAAANALGTTVYRYEEGGIEGRFDLFSHATHDSDAIQKRMISSFQNEKNPFKFQFASDWFLQRQSRSDSEVRNFTKRQKIGYSLKLDESASYIIFYSTSSDEAVSLGEEWQSVFGSQEAALARIYKLVELNTNFKLIIRTHPNMLNKRRSTLRLWNNFVSKFPDAIHIKANSKIDSYALLDQVEKVVVYGSTIGIEAAYVGKDVATLSPSVYDKLGLVKTIVSDTDFLNWIESKPKLIPIEKALPFGFFSRARGFRYDKYRSFGITAGEYNELSIGIKNLSLRTIFGIEHNFRRWFW